MRDHTLNPIAAAQQASRDMRPDRERLAILVSSNGPTNDANNGGDDSSHAGDANTGDNNMCS